jgi:hypothetical protein
MMEHYYNLSYVETISRRVKSQRHLLRAKT